MPTTSAASAEKPAEADVSRLDQAVQRLNERARAAADRAQSDSRSVLWRNRRQLAPWLFSAGTLATGELGALSSLALDPGLATAGTVTAAAAAAVGTGFWLRQRLAATWQRWSRRITTGLAAGAVWSGALPLVGADEPGMYLGLAAGTVALGAGWWQAYRPGYPDAPGAAAAAAEPPAPERAPLEQPDTEVEVIAEITPAEEAVEAWNRHVRSSHGRLAGSTARDPRMTEAGLAFTVDLVPLKQHRELVEGQRTALATALDYPESDITIVAGQSQTEVEVRITVASPHTDSGDYAGPRIVVDEAGNTYVELGPYSDDPNQFERYLVATPSGVAHGFVLGSTGSGKSRLVDLIAIALRRLGWQIWYLDPQSGASSAALRDEADWPLLGLHDGSRNLGNARDLIAALQRVAAIRNKENGAAKRTSFQHTPERPAIAVIIDECQEVLNEKNPDSGRKFGAELADLARILRKLGIKLLLGSQTYTLPTFGGSGGAALRDALIAGNCVIMRVADRNAVGTAIAGSKLQPWKLPQGGGYGFSTTSRRPNVVWRGQCPQDPAWWLRQFPRGDLDARAAKAAGQAYQNRHQRFAEQEEITQAELAAFDAATGDDEVAALLHQRRPGVQSTSSSETGPGRAARRPAPEPAGAQAATASATVTAMPLSPSRLSALQDEDPGSRSREPGQLAQRHQQLLDLLDTHGQLSTQELASEIGISPQAVRKHLTPLREAELVRETTRGVYARGR